MASFKDFDAARREHQREQMTFRLGGEIFMVSATIPAGIVMDLAAKSEAGGAEAFNAFAEFLDAVIVKTDRAKFKRVLNDTDDPVDLDIVMEIVEWIVEAVTGRPTRPSSDSSAGPPTTTPMSKHVSLERREVQVEPLPSLPDADLAATDPSLAESWT